jgi:hypothetical protein
MGFSAKKQMFTVIKQTQLILHFYKVNMLTPSPMCYWVHGQNISFYITWNNLESAYLIANTNNFETSQVGTLWSRCGKANLGVQRLNTVFGMDNCMRFFSFSTILNHSHGHNPLSCTSFSITVECI